MRKIITLVVLAMITTADTYKLSGVRRVDKDLYRSGSLYIETSYCYHYTYGEDAVPKWNGLSGKIIWDDNSSCDVKKVFRK